MNNDKYAGEMLTSFQKWIKKAAQANTPEDVLKVNRAFTEELKAGAFPGTLIRVRRVSDIHPASATPSDPVVSEIYVDIQDKGIRLSAFYGPKGEFIGWSFFHKGNIPMSEIRKHLSNFKRFVRRRSPQKVFDGPHTDVEIYDLIETRKDWMLDEDESVGGRGPTKKEACQRIILKHYPNEDSEDDEFINKLLNCHERVYRRLRKKSG